jgi:hypothetical protein
VKLIYGVAGIYSNTRRASQIVKVSNTNQKIRLDNLAHDLAVIDTAIHFHSKGIPFEEMTTERELHMQDGFGVRRHRPDFVFTEDGQRVCVEVELTLKSKGRFEDIIVNNFIGYARQIWIVPDSNTRIAKILRDNQMAYPNIEIMELREVQS